MPPPLTGDDGLLNRTGLPADFDPYYDDVTLKDVPLCGSEDKKDRRLVTGSANGTEYVDYPRVEDLSDSFKAPGIDDDLLKRILTAAGGFSYSRMAVTKDGREINLGPGVLHLCREDFPAASKTPAAAIYISNNAVINNLPPHGGPLRRVPFQFRPEEILAIVSGLKNDDGSAFRLSGDHYQVDPADHSQLSLMPDRTELQNIIRGLQRADSPVSPGRRASIVAALEAFIRVESDQAAALTEQLRFPPWAIALVSTILGAGLGTFFTWLIMRKQIRMQEEGLSLMKDQMEENRRLMDGESHLDTAQREKLFKGVSRDITDEARKGALDPVLGRDRELAQLFEVLEANRLTGAQIPALIGERGVGKSSLAEGLAQAIEDGSLPQFKGWKVVEIDIPALIAGTGIRGSFENKMRAVIETIEKTPNTFFFMDEVHQIMGAGKTEGSSIDAAQIMKRVMARRGLPLIVGTTLKEYKEYIMKDEAFESRLSPIEIKPVSGTVRTLIFRGVRDFVLALSRDMDVKAGEAPRRLSLPDSVIEHLGNLVGGNNREIKKTLGRIVARARASSAPGSEVPVTAEDVDRMIRELNETRLALGQSEFRAVSPLSGAAPAPTSPSPSLPSPEALALITEETFVEMIQDRYRSQDRTLRGETARTLAKRAYELWMREGRMTTVLDGHLLPVETTIEATLAEAYRRTGNNPIFGELRQGYEADRGRLGEGKERKMESLSDSFRENSQKAFRIMTLGK